MTGCNEQRCYYAIALSCDGGVVIRLSFEIASFFRFVSDLARSANAFHFFPFEISGCCFFFVVASDVSRFCD